MGLRTARIAALVLGLLAAVAVAFNGRMPEGSGRLGLDLKLVVQPTGELAVSPSGAVIRASGLEAGTERSGELTVRNQTAAPVDVQLRMTAAGREVDRLLWIEAASGDTTLLRGPLGHARSWTARSLRLAPGDARPLRVRVWLPEGAGSGYRGRIEDMTLELRSLVGGEVREP